jgi:hypothetical protein
MNDLINVKQFVVLASRNDGSTILEGIIAFLTSI